MRIQGLVTLAVALSLSPAWAAVGDPVVRIAVVRGPFVIEDTGFDSLEQAETVRRHASDGIRLDAGYEIVDNAEVDNAALSAAGTAPSGKPNPCLDEGCLAQISRLVGATGAVQLDVIKRVDGSYAVTVRSAITPPQTDEVDKGVAVVLEVARRLAGGASRRIAETQLPAPPPQPEPESDTDTDMKVEPEAPAPKSQGLHRGWFWGSLALTGAMGLSWGIVEGVAWGKIQDVEEKSPRTQADIDSLKGPQVGARVLLITSATLAVATAVLAVFTDFEGETAVAPVVTDNAVGLGLARNF